MFKKLFNRFLAGVVICLGYLAGADLWHKLKDPYTRAKWKRKFTNIKNAIFEKDES